MTVVTNVVNTNYAYFHMAIYDTTSRFVRVYNSLDGLNRDLESKNRVLTTMNIASGRFVPTEFLKLLGRDNLVGEDEMVRRRLAGLA